MQIITCKTKKFLEILNNNNSYFYGYNFHNPKVLRYILKSYESLYDQIEDKSYILLNDDDHPVCVFLGTLVKKERFSLNLYHEYPCISWINYKEVTNNQLDIFLNEFEENFKFRDYLINDLCSPITTFLIKKNFKPKNGSIFIIDLNLTESEILNSFSSTHRYKIKKDTKKLFFEIIDFNNIIEENINEFRKFHFLISGKITRPKSSWDEQYHLVKQNNAFIIKASFEGNTASMCFFTLSNGNCVYESGVNNRDLFKEIRGLGHSVLWKAILTAKRKKANTFFLGEEINAKSYTDKEKNIIYFKKKFLTNKKYFLDFDFKFKN